VFLPELFESASFYDAHEEAGSHNENMKSRSPSVRNCRNERMAPRARFELAITQKFRLSPLTDIYICCLTYNAVRSILCV
jgi:hypothetical protein